MTDIEVRDGVRTLSFTGEMIASVSSRRPSSPRWSEYRVYKTAGGAFVLEKAGMSIVVHMPGCSQIIDQLTRFQARHPGKDPADGWWFCEECCNPESYDITALLVENDRGWALVTEDPAQLVDGLYRRSNGTRSLPRLSVEILEQLTRVDPRFDDSFRVEHIS